MIYKNIHKIKDLEFREKVIIAIDFGTKNFGFAISDIGQKIASPLFNYQRKSISGDIDKIASISNQYNTNLLLFGLPKNLDNSTSKTSQQVKSFVNLLNNPKQHNQNNHFHLLQKNYDIFFWDERFSSRAASKVSLNQKKEDKIAATVILQTFLDFINNPKTE